jgi:glycosyltransferase involved in cell wall biosynthesis
VCFPTYDEDYGVVTVEAFASRKAVLTCTDSGGPAELVTDDVTGKVCAPRPETLAVALRELMEDQKAAERMGQAGLEFISQMTWSKAVHRLMTT